MCGSGLLASETDTVLSSAKLWEDRRVPKRLSAQKIILWLTSKREQLASGWLTSDDTNKKNTLVDEESGAVQLVHQNLNGFPPQKNLPPIYLDLTRFTCTTKLWKPWKVAWSTASLPPSLRNCVKARFLVPPTAVCVRLAGKRSAGVRKASTRGDSRDFGRSDRPRIAWHVSCAPKILGDFCLQNCHHPTNSLTDWLIWHCLTAFQFVLKTLKRRLKHISSFCSAEDLWPQVLGRRVEELLASWWLALRQIQIQY